MYTSGKKRTSFFSENKVQKKRWKPENRILKSGIQPLMESGIHGCGIRNPQTWNPESTAWNPESRTLLDYLTWGETYLYPDDLEEPSTLSHLISGRRLLSLPDTTRSGADNSSTLEIVTRRARYLQRLMDHLWNRWRREYIPALRESHRLKLDSGGHSAGRWRRQCTWRASSPYEMENGSRSRAD